MCIRDSPNKLDTKMRLNSLLLLTKVFARMTPTHKAMLVELLQGQGRCVAMVGDGANDVAALKQADVGLSLSVSEASIAAPFTSREIRDISSIVILLREGRCCLATNFQCFKFMALYSMIQFTSVIILYFHQVYLADMQFLFQDLLLVTPVFFSIPQTPPFDKLSKQLPSDSLFSLTSLASVIGQTLLQMAGQVTIFTLLTHTQNDWFVPTTTELENGELTDALTTEAPECGVIFLYTNLLYLAAALAFNISRR
eukprot:TRINITY_DN9233_c0_g1_i2.p1 TRINITY_DN9233_c0_g1~~TRINITY_DN9233_c0_g1_i2.p1  ORF type:complete len:273 (-),score=89.28 TRINITY_DN9233_c0_g1_i2:301-1062(-)